jgi:hypothetical protein
MIHFNLQQEACDFGECRCRVKVRRYGQYSDAGTLVETRPLCSHHVGILTRLAGLDYRLVSLD